MTLRRFVPCVALTAALVAGCSSSGGGTFGGGSGQASTPASGTSRPTSAPSGSSGAGGPSSDSSTGSSSVGTGGDTTGRVTSPDGSFSVQVPAGWREDKATATKLHVAEVYAGPAADGFTVNVNVVIEDAGSLTLDQYLQKALGELKSQLPITDQTQPESTTLDGSPALTVSFADTQSGFHLQQAQIVSLHSGKAYVATYTAPAGKAFQTSADAVGQIKESWRWT